MRPAPSAKQFRRGAGGGKYWPGGSEGFYYSVVVKKEVVAGYITSLTGDVFTSPFYLLAACIQTPKNALEKKSEGNTSVTVKKSVSSETAVGCITLCLEVVPIRLIQGYLPYGTLEKRKDPGSDMAASEAFTGKEFEDASGLYYFGARWYDPELGIWLVPDGAGQFVNPYNYVGGNPINFVDANGLWSLGLGVVFGYDKRGWHAGFGAAADVDLGAVELNFKATHVWSTNGTQTSSLNAGAGFQVGILGLDAGAGASYNDRDGTAVNTHVGANIVAVGAEVGTNQAWDKGGDYLGGNVYAEGYLGIKGLLSYGGGYELGWKGFRSGFYQNATFAMQNWSDHGNGWDYDGFEQNFSVYSHTFASKNHAELMTDPTLAGGNGHNSIKGAFNGENFDISVGTNADVNQVLMGSNSTLTGQSATTGIPVSLSGLSIGKLNQFSKALHMVRDAGLLPYNLLALNCGFYTTAAMAFAGRPSYYLVQPNLMAAEARFLGGRGL